MGVKDFLTKVSKKFDVNNIQKTKGDIQHIGDLTRDATKAVSGRDDDILEKSLNAGVKAALAASALSAIIMPTISAPVAAATFVGAGLYKFYKESIQSKVLSAIRKDGLTPIGNPISNGLQASQPDLRALTAQRE